MKLLIPILILVFHYPSSRLDQQICSFDWCFCSWSVSIPQLPEISPNLDNLFEGASHEEMAQNMLTICNWGIPKRMAYKKCCINGLIHGKSTFGTMGVLPLIASELTVVPIPGGKKRQVTLAPAAWAHRPHGELWCSDTRDIRHYREKTNKVASKRGNVTRKLMIWWISSTISNWVQKT